MSTRLLFVPEDDTFFGREFREAPELEELVDHLTETHLEIAFIRDHSVRVLWKRNASKGAGKEVAGKCRLLSGELEFFVGADWLITLAADHCRDWEYGPREIEALLYHELKHCTVKGKEGEEKPAVRKHDLETFFDEVRRYGLWTPELRQAKKAFEQLPLEGFDTKPPSVRELRPALQEFLGLVEHGLPERYEELHLDERLLLGELQATVGALQEALADRVWPAKVTGLAAALATQTFVLSELYRPADPETGEIPGDGGA